MDDGFSGSNFERPDFKRMIADVEDGYVSTVIVKDMSRFGRDHIFIGYYTKYFLPEADVRFIAIYDQVDSETNPDDDIIPFKNILMSCSHKEWYKIQAASPQAVLSKQKQPTESLSAVLMLGIMLIVDKEAYHKQHRQGQPPRAIPYSEGTQSPTILFDAYL